LGLVHAIRGPLTPGQRTVVSGFSILFLGAIDSMRWVNLLSDNPSVIVNPDEAAMSIEMRLGLPNPQRFGTRKLRIRRCHFRFRILRQQKCCNLELPELKTRLERGGVCWKNGDRRPRRGRSFPFPSPTEFLCYQIRRSFPVFNSLINGLKVECVQSYVRYSSDLHHHRRRPGGFCV